MTLSIDPTVVIRAKRYARRRGTSVSKLVETYLQAVSDPPKPTDEPPVLRALRGILKSAGAESHRKYLAHKYR